MHFLIFFLYLLLLFTFCKLQPSSGNGPGVAGQQISQRGVPRQMQSMVGMPRVGPNASMAAYNAASQAGMANLNPANIPMQRGTGQQQASYFCNTSPSDNCGGVKFDLFLIKNGSFDVRL